MYYKKKVHKYLSIFQLSRKSETRFFKRIKLRTYWRPSRKIFSMNYTEVNNFLKKYPAKEVEQSFMKQSFLLNKRKRLNTISETKPNNVHLKQTILLSSQQQIQDLRLLSQQGLDYLTLQGLYLLILCHHFFLLAGLLI